MMGILWILVSCSEYNLATDGVKDLGFEAVDTSEDASIDTAEDNDSGDTPDEPITETDSEPSTEPVEDEGLNEPTLETDVGYDPDSGLNSNLGNVVTILMALSEQWIPEETARQLLINSVDFATDVPDPDILVIRDDNTNGEDEDDPCLLYTSPSPRD